MVPEEPETLATRASQKRLQTASDGPEMDRNNGNLMKHVETAAKSCCNLVTSSEPMFVPQLRVKERKLEHLLQVVALDCWAGSLPLMLQEDSFRSLGKMGILINRFSRNKNVMRALAVPDTEFMYSVFMVSSLPNHPKTNIYCWNDLNAIGCFNSWTFPSPSHSKHPSSGLLNFHLGSFLNFLNFLLFLLFLPRLLCFLWLLAAT